MTGRDLRTLREACGVTVWELADAAGFRLTYVSDVESDMRGIHWSELDLWIATLARVVRDRAPVAAVLSTEAP